MENVLLKIIPLFGAFIHRKKLAQCRILDPICHSSSLSFIAGLATNSLKLSQNSQTNGNKHLSWAVEESGAVKPRLSQQVSQKIRWFSSFEYLCLYNCIN